MNFTEYEQEVIKELEQRAGDVLYFEDFAPYFISKSLLQLSTYTHTAYIQLGEKMQTALSEYFQLIVFIRKMEANGACFSISYTPLEDNSVLIGQRKYSDYQQHTIADGDLLIQLFQYAAKKYVMAAKISEQFVVGQRPARNNFIIPSMVLLLLFIFIGAMAYQSYQDRNILKMQQEAIEADLEKQTESIELLTEQFEAREKVQNQLNADMRQEINLINQSLVKQNKSLRSVRYWNKQQYGQLEKLIENLRRERSD